MESNHQQLRNDKWMNLIASNWFSIFLEYLNLYDITQIDSSFCNHIDRPVWLNLLRNARPIVEMNDLSIHEITDWLILKDVHPSGMTIFVVGDEIASDTLLRLSRISLKLRKLKCHTNDVHICNALLRCFGDYNESLEELDVNFYCIYASSLSESDVEQFKESTKHFLAGCPLLHSLALTLYQLPTQTSDVCISICSTLFQCLGDYNPLLDKLELDVSYKSDFIQILSESDFEQCKASMKHFLVRCPTLTSLTLDKLASQCIAPIPNYALNLETLIIRGDLQSIITKEADQLKKLSYLELASNSPLINESLINLVTGCDQLEMIRLGICTALTDISLYSIADNCPNLKKIWLPLGYNEFEGNITVEGLLALVNKCPKLEQIDTWEAYKLPEVIQLILKNRVKTLKLQHFDGVDQCCCS